MKPKIALFNHSYHRKTASSAFFLELLKTAFTVDTFWCDSWKTGCFIDLAKQDLSRYDALVFFQVLYPTEAMAPYRDRCTLVPMLDGAWRDSDLFWLKYRHFRFLNFSRALHDRLKRLGLNSLYVQYFPPVSTPVTPIASESETRSAFYWQRSSDISWNTIKRLIKHCKIKKVYYHTEADNQAVSGGPAPDDIRRYDIAFSQWFPDKSTYWSRLDKADIYFAPRVREGVGLSFLEAMARGKCVVAPDKPTMNEYIVNGVTGRLYNPRWPRPLRLNDVSAISLRAADFIRKGRETWEMRQEEILAFISNPNSGRCWQPQNARWIWVRALVSALLGRPLTFLQKQFDQACYYLIRKGIVLNRTNHQP